MTKSKSPRRAASPSTKNNNSDGSNSPHGNYKHSIGTAAAALQAATLTNAYERHSPPPSPKHLRYPASSPSSKNSSPTSGPTAASKEVKTTIKEAVKDVTNVVRLAAEEFETVVENKRFTPMEGRHTVKVEAVEPPSAMATTTASKINSRHTDDESNNSIGQDQIPLPLFSTALSGSGYDGTVTGVGGGNGRVRGLRDSRSTLLAPSALSYLSSNLFDNLRLDRDTTDFDKRNVSDSSESSDDNETDYSDNISDSNSTHSSENEEEEEEDEDEEEEGEEEEDIDESVDKDEDKSLMRKKKYSSKRMQESRKLSPEHSPIRSTMTERSHSHGQHHHHHQRHIANHRKGLDKEAVVLLADESAKAKWANWSVRTLWTLIMIGGFFACVAAGPLFVILLVVVVQSMVYKEVIFLATVPSKEKKLPWFRAMNWYFLFSTNYFFYGESLIHYFQHVVFVDAFLLPFATHHRFISFILYVIGFVFFVANLKKGHYRFQFSQFAWTHMTLLLVVCQSHFIINNIFEGLIWFFLPVSLVIANDIWAYIFGFFFGKTPLIKLSPKKTVEGFVGGWVMTILFGILFATLFLRYPYMICPVKDLRATAFSGLTCDPNPVFIPVKHYLKPWMFSLVRHLGYRHNYVMIAPLQLHAIFMACFASLIAPFGGFFASGFKRAFKIKDFGQSIPGHGGITDRMDCQFLMGLFSYMYYQSFIKTSAVTVGIVLQSAIHNLKGQEQMELFDHLRHYLIGQGLLDEDSCVIMPPKEAWIS